MTLKRRTRSQSTVAATDVVHQTRERGLDDIPGPRGIHALPIIGTMSQMYPFCKSICFYFSIRPLR